MGWYSQGCTYSSRSCDQNWFGKLCLSLLSKMSQTVKLTLWLRSGLWLCTESTPPALAYTFITNDVGQDRYGIFVAFFATTEAAETGTHPCMLFRSLTGLSSRDFAYLYLSKKFFNNNNLDDLGGRVDGGIGGKEGMGVELGIGVTMGRRPRHLTPTTPVTVVPPFPSLMLQGSVNWWDLVGPQILFRKFIISK